MGTEEGVIHQIRRISAPPRQQLLPTSCVIFPSLIALNWLGFMLRGFMHSIVSVCGVHAFSLWPKPKGVGFLLNSWLGFEGPFALRLQLSGKLLICFSKNDGSRLNFYVRGFLKGYLHFKYVSHI